MLTIPYFIRRCPNCHTYMNTIIKHDETIWKCEKCNYEEENDNE